MTFVTSVYFLTCFYGRSRDQRLAPLSDFNPGRCRQVLPAENGCRCSGWLGLIWLICLHMGGLYYYFICMCFFDDAFWTNMFYWFLLSSYDFSPNTNGKFGNNPLLNSPCVHVVSSTSSPWYKNESKRGVAEISFDFPLAPGSEDNTAPLDVSDAQTLLCEDLPRAEISQADVDWESWPALSWQEVIYCN